MADTYDWTTAVVTGGGTGMGRELVRQLAAAGCHVATCDVNVDDMAETLALATADAPSGTRLASFQADVRHADALVAFAEHVRAAFDTDRLDLLMNNAGIGGGGSIVVDDAQQWQATFDVCWGGVLHSTRAFLPMLLASPDAHVVNTSSVNGFWASLGPGIPHTAYSAAKFAVKGFTEALIADFRAHAPHVHAHVVMPGHIGTSIAINSAKYHGRDPKEMGAEQLDELRERLVARHLPVGDLSDEDLRTALIQQGEQFRDTAPMTAAEAATVILRAVQRGEWRILVGADAVVMDEMVRADPWSAYEPDFVVRLHERGALRGVVPTSDEE
jgi:NAD(P)-dependent dehydrogenase (short-subunit alcohol dehydrogenase family)